jgi:hypothetical protein
MVKKYMEYKNRPTHPKFPDHQSTFWVVILNQTLGNFTNGQNSTTVSSQHPEIEEKEATDKRSSQI